MKWCFLVIKVLVKKWRCVGDVLWILRNRFIYPREPISFGVGLEDVVIGQE